MIMSDHLITLQVPTFNHLILPAREQIRMPWRHRQSSNRADMARQAELQLARSHIPNLHYSVTGTGSEPFVARFDCDGAHPA